MKIDRKIIKYRKNSVSIVSRLFCLALTWALPVGLLWAQGSSDVRSTLETSHAGVNARIDLLGSVWRVPPAIDANQSRILVYRSAANTLAGTTSVFINGQYHTSLVSGGYSALCYSPGKVEIGARQMRVGSQAKDLMDTLSELSLQPGQTHYLKVIEQGGVPLMQPVSASVAHQELGGLRYQLHTVSRVEQAQACREVGLAVSTNPEPQKIALATDALFEFGRADRSAMTLAGRRALDKLIEQMQGQYIQLDRIQIVGHADPLGHPEINSRLADQRATTVRDYLLGRGLKTARISSEGRGSREPVVTHCETQVTQAAIDCNQPNRRVVVEVHGTPR